tara:strand:+ start:2365 stop:2901 length:537 start_codon:yes stop_codon:yes gene_type:complete
MSLVLSQLAADHSIPIIFAALVICGAAGWLLAALRVRAASSTGTVRFQWLAGTAVVAGLGVWTTHFMAMIGYRPDLPLGYETSVTAASAAIAILAVGIPIAATSIVRQQTVAIALGASAGLGIGAMHYTGMAALEGCLQSQEFAATIAAYATGAFLMAAGCSSRRITASLASSAQLSL